ncbi:MAG: hypothetical protein Q4G47_08400, partial [Lachnospiraceae bacterium]|nr:hypothetical protein [Lachnospiraceae bacterium]
LISNSVKGAREAADALSHAAEETAANVSVMTKETAQKISKAAKDAIDNLTGAAYYVMDKAGNIISMVSETTIRVTDNARKAVDIIARFGPAIMEATKSSIAKLDLSDDRSEEVLNRSIRIALTGANRTGLLGKNITDETITIVSDVMTKAIVYGWRYSMGMITLKEYVSVMSEIIIKNGLPTGVGMLASLLPLDGASDIAYNATEYLVKKVYTEEQDENVISAASEAVPAAA